MVAILRDPDEHARIADRCARKFGPAPPRKAMQENEQQEDEDASDVTRLIVWMSGFVWICSIGAAAWVVWRVLS